MSILKVLMCAALIGGMLALNLELSRPGVLAGDAAHGIQGALQEEENAELELRTTMAMLVASHHDPANRREHILALAELDEHGQYLEAMRHLLLHDTSWPASAAASRYIGLHGNSYDLMILRLLMKEGIRHSQMQAEVALAIGRLGFASEITDFENKPGFTLAASKAMRLAELAANGHRSIGEEVTYESLGGEVHELGRPGRPLGGIVELSCLPLSRHARAGCHLRPLDPEGCLEQGPLSVPKSLPEWGEVDFRIGGPFIVP